MKLNPEILQKVRHIEIHTRRLLSGLVAGDASSSKKGFGLEFDQLRDYQVGDDVRCIDWKSTARADKLLVREYKEDRNRTIFLVVDGSASMFYGSSEELKNDLAAQVSSVLALVADYSRDLVGMVLFSDDKKVVLPPSRGRAHVHKMMETLFMHKPSGNASLNDALHTVIQMKRKDMIVVIVSDFLSTQYDKSLKMVSKRHETFAIHCYDQLEVAMPAFGLLSVQDPETGKNMLISTDNKKVQTFLAQQQYVLKDLCNRARVELLSLQTGKPFVGELIRFFKKQML
jgi:uncharacterized protein (DUF58 family)